jgi:hypothetical protein
MNILLAYHSVPEKDIWNTPVGIGKSFQKKGHNVFYVPNLNPNNLTFDNIYTNINDADFILFCWCGPSESFDYEIKKLKNNTNKKIYLELGDEPQTFLYNQKRIFFADGLLTPDLRCHKHYQSKGFPSYWLTHWCDDKIFYKKENSNKKNICVTTCGNRPFVDKLSEKFKDQFINQKVWNYDNTDFFNSGTVCYQYARYDEITRRLFEAGGCGNAILTNRISPESGIYELFTEDEDMAFFSTEEECLAKMDKLLNDSVYRNKLSTNLYKKITSKHMVGNRVDEIIRIYNNDSCLQKV